MKTGSRIFSYLINPVHIAPLAILRIAFGAIMLISTIRFILKGWVTEFYVTPKIYFTFYGFDWVRPFSEVGMYAVFGIMALTSLFVMMGLFYRVSIVTFLMSFIYVELLDKTNYLNHYYFITVFTFLMTLVPAHRYFSLDILRKPDLKITHAPTWCISIFKLQLFIVYFFAGLSKLNSDWMLEAMPLKIWLPANSHLPIIGSFLAEKWVAYFFCWFGAFYDLTIGFFLLKAKTRKIAYIFVIVFHLFTAWFFKIGMFPYIMIFLTIIFFSEDFHKKLINSLRIAFSKKDYSYENLLNLQLNQLKVRSLATLLVLFFSLQLILPFRFLLYPGHLFWTEEGYRFSWRVMLMEKGGTTFFYVSDPSTGRRSEINNSEFLTPQQERMMATQPDMILQYAHFLDQEFKKRGIKDPVVSVESYVTLNGSGSRPFIDSNVDLSKEEESFEAKTWIIPFENK